jgi:ParB family chromosome partitioning protein
VSSEKTRLVQDLPLERVSCAPQVRERFDADALSGLGKSMEKAGLLQPILVRPDADGWSVIDGERRLRAAMALGWRTIPAIVDTKELTDRDRTQSQLVANCQRADLSPIETARAIDRLIKSSGWSMSEVAAQLGFSAASVSRSMKLLTLPADLQERIHRGELAPNTGYEIAKTKDEGRRAELVATASRGELKRDIAARQSSVGRKRRTSSSAHKRGRRIAVPIGDGYALLVVVNKFDSARLVAALESTVARLGSLNGGAGMDAATTLSSLAKDFDKKE